MIREQRLTHIHTLGDNAMSAEAPGVFFDSVMVWMICVVADEQRQV